MVYALEQEIFTVLKRRRLNESATATSKSFQSKLSVRKGPYANTIKQLFEKFRRIERVADDLMGNIGRPQLATSATNAHPVQNSITEYTKSYIRETAASWLLSSTSTYRNLRTFLEIFR